MKKALLVMLVALAATLSSLAVVNASPITTVTHVSPRSSTSILAVTGPMATYDAKTDAGSECSSLTHLSLQPIWNVRQVSRTSVNLYSVSFRMYNNRGVTLAGGYIETGGSSYTYRTGATYYATGSRMLTYPINRTLTLNAYHQLRLRQNFEFGSYGTEPYWCNGKTFLGMWLQVD